VPEAIVHFSKIFKRIVVVTNQQGIGKGVMTESNLSTVHTYMVQEIEKLGGRIDAVYFAPQLAKENSLMRKPEGGMALKA
jgi:histidinol phosphatase-like enzyme